MSLSFLRVKDCSGYRPSVGLRAGPVAKACARISGKPGPQGNAQKKQIPINGATFSASIAQTTYLQSLDYRYNIKGQLLTINNSTLSNDNGTTNNDSNDLFGMTLLYDQQDGTLYNGAGNTAYHNGKLSAVKWMNKDANGNSTAEKSYVYNYDPLNRLTGAGYSERTAGSTGNFGNNVDAFDENGIQYDENGNITQLNRTSGGTNIDQLAYSYNGNQLTAVADNSGNTAGFIPGSGSYGYDANGNITTDPYKGLTNYYNILNRVEHTTINSKGTIYYTYTAGGTLLRKQQYNTANALQKTTDYIDGFEYEQGALNYFGMPEGRVLSTGGALKLEFIMSDQQGNARISFDNSGTGGIAQVKQENSYYAFGMTYQSITPGNPNLQLYNGGSEWQRDYGDQLPGYYQTFYRNYDAALGRWISVDPEAESAESMTTYQYSMNNPVMFNDPMGNKIPTPGSRSGGYFGQDNLSSDPEWFTMLQAHMQADDAETAADFASIMSDGSNNGGGGGPGDGSGSASEQAQAAGAAHITDPGQISQIYNDILSGSYRIGANADGSTSFSYTEVTPDNNPISGVNGYVGYANDVRNVTVNGSANQGGRPLFSDLQKNYPTTDNVADVYKLVGGGLLRSYNQDPISYGNTCAMRLSYALNKSGAPIPYVQDKTFKGANNLNYFIRVKDMAKYMDKTYGQPDLNGTNESVFSGHQGIIQFNVSGWSDATGHFTLWDGTNTSYGNYFNVNKTEPGVTLTGVHLWIFK